VTGVQIVRRTLVLLALACLLSVMSSWGSAIAGSYDTGEVLRARLKTFGFVFSSSNGLGRRRVVVQSYNIADPRLHPSERAVPDLADAADSWIARDLAIDDEKGVGLSGCRIYDGTGWPWICMWSAVELRANGSSFQAPQSRGCLLLKEGQSSSLPGITMMEDVRALPFMPVWRGMMFNLGFYMIACVGIGMCALASRRRWRISRGRCATCNYDLQSSAGGRCSECGTVIPGSRVPPT
jgi:hypothetical protein